MWIVVQYLGDIKFNSLWILVSLGFLRYLLCLKVEGLHYFLTLPRTLRSQPKTFCAGFAIEGSDHMADLAYP